VRRADRLFQVVQLLRGGGVHTAASLAVELEVSERTLYRDILDLVASGVPIEGEAGVGYVMRRGFDLPPLMFDEDEIEALVLGARMVEAWADDGLARSARSLLSKVRAVLPAALEERLKTVSLFAPEFHVPESSRSGLTPLRRAVSERRCVRFHYDREDGETSARTVRPLGLSFWGQRWTLVAWCELRGDFRNFRTDRLSVLEVLEQRFEPEVGRGLADFIARMRGEE
jgi:predicted DNA-binding transcriptional regulator YafY